MKKTFYNDCTITVYKKSETKFEARVKCAPNDDGSIDEFYAYAKTYKDATEKGKKKIDEFLAKKKLKELKSYERFTIYSFMKEFVRHASLSIKEASNQRNIDTLKTFERDPFLHDFVSNSIVTINKSQLLDVVEYLCNNSGNSLLRKQLIMLSNAFDIAFADELINRNLFKVVFKKLPKSKVDKNEGIRNLTLLEQQKIISILQSVFDEVQSGCKLTAKRQAAFIIAIEYYSGMRPGEILALHKKDIDFENHIIRVKHTITRTKDYKQEIGTPKTDNGFREVYMITILEKLMKLYFRVSEEAIHRTITNDLVFVPIRSGTMLGVAAINSRFKELFQDCLPDTKICQYMLRHTFASNCYTYGIRDNTISSLMGHSKKGITNQVYVTVNMTTITEEFSQMILKMEKDDLMIKL